MNALLGAAGGSRGYVTHLFGVVLVTCLALIAITLLAAIGAVIPDVLIVVVTGGAAYLLGNVSGARAASKGNDKNGAD